MPDEEYPGEDVDRQQLDEIQWFFDNQKALDTPEKVESDPAEKDQ